MKSVKELIGDNIPTTNFVNRLVFMGLGITTAITANNIALEKLSATFLGNRFVAATLSVIIAGIIGVIFDHGLRRNFISALQMFNADDFKTATPSIKFVVYGFLLIALFRLGLSTGATFISAIFISDSLVEDGNTDELEKMLSNKEKTKQDITLTLARQIKDVRSDSKKRANDIVNDAINSGGKRWAKLWTSGNSWIRTVKGEKYKDLVKWREKIYKAEAKANEIKQEASKQIAALQTSQTQLIESETNDKSFSAITQIKARQIQKLESKESITRFSLWMIDAVMSFIAILTSIGLAVAEKHNEGYKIFKDETSLGDILKEAWNSFSRIVLSYMVVGVVKMDVRAKRVASSASNGDGFLTLEAETLKMYRGSNKEKQQIVAPKNPVGSTLHADKNKVPTKVKWGARIGMPTSADNADKLCRQSADTNKNAPSNRVGNTADNKSVVIQTTKIDGVPYVYHVGKSGKKMKWTRRDVEKNLNTYQSRMDAAKQNGKQGVYENNKQKVDMMLSYIKRLESMK